MFSQGFVGEKILSSVCHLSSNKALCTNHPLSFSSSSLCDQGPKRGLHKDQSLKVSMDLLKLVPMRESSDLDSS